MRRMRMSVDAPFAEAIHPMTKLETLLAEALEDANQMCRSAYQIAVREGRETHWDGFLKQLEASLKKQLAALEKARTP